MGASVVVQAIVHNSTLPTSPHSHDIAFETLSRSDPQYSREEGTFRLLLLRATVVQYAGGNDKWTVTIDVTQPTVNQAVTLLIIFAGVSRSHRRHFGPTSGATVTARPNARRRRASVEPGGRICPWLHPRAQVAQPTSNAPAFKPGEPARRTRRRKQTFALAFFGFVFFFRKQSRNGTLAIHAWPAEKKFSTACACPKNSRSCG